MEEKVFKQLDISPTLERKRARYTVEDVRQLCGGISRSTVMREIRRKRLACYRARRTLRFSEEHITKYLESVANGKMKLLFRFYLSCKDQTNARLLLPYYSQETMKPGLPKSV